MCLCACMCVQSKSGWEIWGGRLIPSGRRMGNLLRINLIKNHERRLTLTHTGDGYRIENASGCYACNCIERVISLCLSFPNMSQMEGPQDSAKPRKNQVSLSLSLSLSIEDKSPTRAHGVSRLTFDCVMLAPLIDTLHFR